MALSVSERSGSNPDVWGRKRVNVVRVTFDDSYPAGGEAFDPANYGVIDPIFVSVANRTTGHVVVFDPAAEKLKAYWVDTTVDGAPLSEVAATTDLATLVADVLIVGY